MTTTAKKTTARKPAAPAARKEPAPFILGKRPESISDTIEFPLPDGTDAKIPCQFKYRTRKEFGDLWDQITAEAGESVKIDGDKFSFAGMFERGDAVNAANALEYLMGWPDTMPPLTKETLIELFDQAPAAAQAFWNGYRDLCTKGRVGN